MAKRFDSDSAEPEWGLYVDEQRRDLTARKSIKVKLPIRQHIKLHALKLFSENNISQTVEVALDLYFDRMRAAELQARAAAGEGAAVGAGDAGAGAAAAVGAGADGGAGAGAGPGTGEAGAAGAGPGELPNPSPQGPGGPGL